MSNVDGIENRSDVINNIKTLYSYATSNSVENRDYAIEIYKNGRNHVVEKIDGKLFFAPSRFVGYKDNTKEKHDDNNDKHGSYTNNLLKKLYKKITDKDPDFETLSKMFNEFLSEFDIQEKKVKFWYPTDLELPNYINNELNMKTSKYKDLLFANKNIVLTGAPGTGKSYLAKKIAEQITGTKYEENSNQIGFVQFHPSYDYTDFVEGLRAEEVESGGVTFTLKNGMFKEFCKRAINKTESCSKGNFDELYDEFTSFISEEGLKLKTPTRNKDFKVTVNSKKSLYAIPDTEAATQMIVTKHILCEYVTNGKIVDWKPYTVPIGDKFKSMYGDKLQLPTNVITDKKNYVFIIDEINRGEISKIFGELFYSIDPGYRGKAGKVNTQYQNLHSYENDTIFDTELGKGWFYVPDNVYIIGTMNDIDRSVESMDFAMRRRFTWVEIDAESRTEMLNEYDWAEEAKNKMKDINTEIEKIEGLGKAYHIGPAYFLKLESYENDTDTMWNKLWEYHLEPLIREYLRGIPSAEETLKNVKKAYDGENSN